MKAQLNIQYMIAFIVFINIVVFIYLSYSKNVPDFITEISKETVHSQSYQLSELLINDAGEPSNWQVVGSPKRLGFSDELENRSNLISKSKIDYFNSNYDCPVEGVCSESDYNQIRALLGMEDAYPTIIISEIMDDGNRNVLMKYSPPSSPVRELSSKTTRIVAYRDGIQKRSAEVVVLV